MEAAVSYTKIVNQNLTSRYLLEINFWSVFFTIFLGLRIHKAVAAIFWLSSTFV